MTNDERRPIVQAWQHRTGPMADAVEVADLMAATMEAMGCALRPVIGQRGFAALVQRSLHLNAGVHAWLVDVCQSTDKPHPIAALRDALAEQSCVEAVAAGANLLHTFDHLLAGMIGPSLTERLLRPAWEASLGHSPRLEPPP